VGEPRLTRSGSRGRGARPGGGGGHVDEGRDADRPPGLHPVRADPVVAGGAGAADGGVARASVLRADPRPHAPGRAGAALGGSAPSARTRSSRAAGAPIRMAVISFARWGWSICPAGRRCQWPWRPSPTTEPRILAPPTSIGSRAGSGGPKPPGDVRRLVVILLVAKALGYAISLGCGFRGGRSSRPSSSASRSRRCRWSGSTCRRLSRSPWAPPRGWRQRADSC
jgi:hypothetical protein